MKTLLLVCLIAIAILMVLCIRFKNDLKECRESKMTHPDSGYIRMMIGTAEEKDSTPPTSNEIYICTDCPTINPYTKADAINPNPK